MLAVGSGRLLRLTGALLLVAVLASPAGAQGFPDRPVHLIVPFAAGGPTDVFARVVAERVGALFARQVVVENRTGAGGNIAAELVIAAKPDGYTLLFSSAAIAIAPTLYRALKYDPVKDLTPVALIGAVPLILVVRPGVPATLPALLAYLRADPGKYSYGSAGSGTTTHLTVELFKTRAGVEVVHVPYRGSAPAIQELLAGRFEFTIETLSAVKPFLASGQLIPLGVTSAQRSPLMATMPTVAELGLDGVIGSTWNMILAPAGTPQPIVERINATFRQAMADPDAVARLTELAIEPVADSTPASATKFLVDEIARWAPVVKASGATAE